MDTIVLSGINLHSGGTLTIYYDMLNAVIENKLYESYDFICFVYKKELFEKYKDFVKVIEISDSKGNYIKRLYYEYFFFRKFSKNKNIFVWISVQDITPNVYSKKLFTYCHNPMMFYRLRKQDFKYGGRLILFKLLYKFVYGTNIKKNTAIVLQQDWIRREFLSKYKINKVLVARPIVQEKHLPDLNNSDNIKTFIFPSQATFFKNFEIICQAVQILNEKYLGRFVVQITIDGTENKYTKDLKVKYGNVPSIAWLGFLPRDVLYNYYQKSSCMIFPSRLETWGLPISEYKNTGKPIILADLPYAYETIGSYDHVAFFNPDDALALSNIMSKFIDGDESCFHKTIASDIQKPYVNSWSEFWKYIIECEE